MYRFYINKAANIYHFSELIRVFLADDEFEPIAVDFDDAADISLTDNSYLVNKSGSSDQESIKRELYHLLSGLLGTESKWGTLTGVRPLKPMLQAYASCGSDLGAASRIMKEKYLVSDSKLSLLTDIAKYQLSHMDGTPHEKISVYAGIPFCPTRCTYCSFSSTVAPPDKIERYLGLLCREAEYTGELLRGQTDVPRDIESIYIGGGTPTTLSPSQLERLIGTMCRAFSTDPGRIEFTVEAGRPDTLDADKLKALKAAGIDRISINPQTLKDRTLCLIGRRHTAEDIRRAFELASGVGFGTINSDLITGLPEETEEDFSASLDGIVSLGANNITVHTLSIKRGSKMHETDPEYFRRYGETVSAMLDHSRERLGGEGFVPYYIYRQKHQIGALENVGWCTPGSHSVYNIRIMEDRQTTIGLGAGAIGKVYYPDSDRIERVANVGNYEVYIDRFDEMLDRKKGYFQNGNQCT